MANRRSHRRVVSVRLIILLLAASLAGSLQLGCKSKTSKSPRKKAAAQKTSVPADGSPPKLTLGRKFIDAGVLAPQTTREETVNIRNTGGSELVIHKAMEGCKCLRASFDRMRLQPGESARMTVKILTLKLAGDVSEVLGVASNDPAGPKVLAVRFEVRRDLVTVPRRLYLGLARPGQTVRQRVKVVANADVNTKVLYAISSNRALVGRVVEPVLKKDTPAVLEVVFKAPSQTGTYRSDLAITTGHSAQPTVRLPVMLCVSRSASVRPDRLDFGRFTKGWTVKRSLVLKVGAGTKLKAVVARPKILDIEPGRAYVRGAVTVDLTVRKDVRYGRFAGELRLELAGEEQGTLAVPFTGYVAEGAAP